MGDLIIKPESGGSIKLQNYAGTNALVSDNSGNVTLTNATGNFVGTLSSSVIGAQAGTAYFVSAMSTNTGWFNLASGAVVPFNSQEIDDDNVTSVTGGTVRFTAPVTGWYLFGMHIYTAQSDQSNTFNFYIDGSQTDFAPSTDYGGGDVDSGGTHDRMISFSQMLKLNSAQYVTVNATLSSDCYGGHSYWWGSRIR